MAAQINALTAKHVLSELTRPYESKNLHMATMQSIVAFFVRLESANLYLFFSLLLRFRQFIVIPGDMFRPDPARRAGGITPLLGAVRAAPPRIEGMPHMPASRMAHPPISAFRLIKTDRTIDFHGWPPWMTIRLRGPKVHF